MADVDNLFQYFNLYEDIHWRPPRIGFKEDEKTQERYLDTEGIISGKYQAWNSYIECLKLHGSIDWWIRSSDKRIVQKEHPRSLRGEKYREQLMIYPVYEKHISQDPHFSLYYYFRHLLQINHVYLVIGFSFRDPSINNAFRDALVDKAASRMIIVNSNRETIENRVNEIFPRDKIEFIQDRFGSNNLPSGLKDYIR
jgi:SIR2-like domain